MVARSACLTQKDSRMDDGLAGMKAEKWANPKQKDSRRAGCWEQY